MTARTTNESSAEKWVTIDPDDDVDLDPRPQAIRCNASGAINLMDNEGNESGALDVVTGEVLKMAPRRVMLTGTTLAQADILGLY